MRTAYMLLAGMMIAGCNTASQPSQKSQMVGPPVRHSPATRQTSPFDLVPTPPATTAPVGYVLKPNAPTAVVEYWEACQRERLRLLGIARAFNDKVHEAKLMDPYDIEYPPMRSLLDSGVVRGRIIQIVDDRNLIGEAAFGSDNTVCWFTGYPTTSYVDGQRVIFGTFKREGRKQYQSALGMSTIPLLSPLDMETYLVKR